MGSVGGKREGGCEEEKGFPFDKVSPTGKIVINIFYWLIVRTC